MKRNLSKVITILIMIVLMSGCGKNYKKLSYIEYNEYFNKKQDYLMIDHSSENGLEIIRDLEAGNGDIQVMYLEFMTEEEAEKYLKENFDDDNYKTKDKETYTIVKNTKNRYFKLYKIDNVIIYALSNDKKDKKEINSILKDLGY